MKKAVLSMTFVFIATLLFFANTAQAKSYRIKCTSLAKQSCYKRCSGWYIGERQKRCSRLHFGIWRCTHYGRHCRVMCIRGKKGVKCFKGCRKTENGCIAAFFKKTQACLIDAAKGMTTTCWKKCYNKSSKICSSKNCTPCK